MADYIGTDAADYFEGSEQDDSINGAGGDDSISGGGGNDVLLGGTGNDTLDSYGGWYAGNGDVSIDGGEGSDDISAGTLGGTLNINGGAGDFADNIYVQNQSEGIETYDPDTDSYLYTEVGGEVTIAGGGGNDSIRLINSGTSAVIDAGAGQDAITVEGNLAVTVTTGAGSDVITLKPSSYSSSNAITITDFVAGAGGDRINMNEVLSAASSMGWSGGNPFDQGYFALEQEGADVVLRIDLDDTDGIGTNGITRVVFQNTTLANFTSANFVPAMDPGGAPAVGLSLTGTAGDDQLTGELGNDTLSGAAGDDTLDGSFGDDLINAGDGYDIVYGAGQDDTIDGQGGDDQIYGGDGEDLLSGSDGRDYMQGDTGNDTVLGGAGNDVLYGGNGHDSVDGGAGDDDILGNSGNNTLIGGAGDDSIYNYYSSGHESIDGGIGNDSIEFETYGGTLNVAGGDGGDIINIFAEARQEYNYDPETGVETYTYVGGTSTVMGGAGNDTISVSNYDAASTISAGDGDDVVRVRGAGNTVVTTGAGSDRIALNSLPSADGGVVVTDFTTGAGGDRFDLTAILNEISSYGWTEGNPFGQDYLSLEQQGANVVLKLDRDAGGTDFDPVVLITFQNRSVSAFTDDNFIPAYHPDGSAPVGETIVGTAGNDNLIGQEFNDTLQGGAGDDTLDGAAGSDQLDGGAGSDLFLMGEGDTVLAGDGDDVINIVGGRGGAITSGAGADRIVVTSLAASLPGGLVVTDFDTSAGGDKIDLSQVYYTLDEMSESWDPSAAWLIENGKLVFNQVGADTVVVLNWFDWGTELDVSRPILTLRGVNATSLSASHFLPAAPLNLEGGSGNDLLTGDAGRDTLSGMGGNDTLRGGDGRDTLSGGDGADSLEGGLDDDYLYGGFGNDTLLGQAGDDTLNGGSNNDLLDGGAGDDSLESNSSGNDTLLGGEGEDTISVDGSDDDTGDEPAADLLIDGGNGNDTIDINTWSADALNVLAGAGDDYVGLYGGVTRTLDLGAGNDTLQLTMQGTTTVTTGAGSDLIDLSWINSGSPVIITDFTPGNGGDRFDLESVLTYLEDNNYPGGNPFGNGYLVLEQQGANVVLKLDADGTGTSFAPITLAIFQNTTVSAFTAANFVPAIDPAGSPIPGQLQNGTPEDDELSGNLGNDTLNGLAGDDTLNGGSGHDSLDGGQDHDRIYGGGGHDTLLGQTGSDYLSGENGNDSLDGGDEGDTLYGGSGQDTLLGQAGHDELYAGDGNDLVDGGDGHDELFGSYGNDTLLGQAGDDSLDGNRGDDSVSGGDGDDDLSSYEGNDTLLGGAGNDNITFDVDEYYEEEVALYDILIDGGSGNDTISVYGTYAVDTATISGGDGDDNVSVYGGASKTINLGAGNDTLLVRGDATVTTGAGSDYIQPGFVGSSALVITDFTPGAGGDRLDLTNALNYLEARDYEGGNPFANGRLVLEQQGANVVLKLDVDGTGTGYAPIILVTFQNTTASAFTAANFVPAIDPAGSPIPGLLLNGTPDEDDLTGGLGNDTLNGQAGYDDLYGGSGRDSLDGGDDGDELYGGGGQDTLLGQAGNDYLYAGSGNDSLSGGVGNDYLYGDSGNDTLDGGDGDDTLDGASGNNVLSGGLGNDVIEADNGNATLSGGDGDDSLVKESSTGDSFSMDGGVGNDTIRAEVWSNSNVTLLGGAGNDLITFYNNSAMPTSTNTVTVDLGAGNDTLVFDPVGSVTVTTGAGSDLLNLNAYELNLTGQSIVVTDFTAGVGGDRLGLDVALRQLGGYGFEAGNPFAQGYLKLEQQGADVVLKVDLDGNGTDFAPFVLVTFKNTTVSAFKADNFAPAMDPAGGPIPAQLLNGTPDDDALQGGLGNDTLNGLAGDDTLYGSFGHDSLDGGDNGDTLYGDNGNDTLLGQSGDDHLYGGSGADALFGGLGGDVLFGQNGNDTLTGGDGNDSLYAGEGTNSVSGGAGDDWIDGSYGSGTLLGGDGNDTITKDGAKQSSVLADGGAGNDQITIGVNSSNTVTLIGGSGDDYVNVNVDYGAFADNDALSTLTVDLGSGNDTFSFDPLGSVTVTTGTGSDIVNLSVFGPNTTGQSLVITDFTAGNGGDRLGLADALNWLEGYGFQAGNPFAQGYLKLEQVGADVVLKLDLDGTGTAYAPVTLATLRNTTVSAFTAANFVPTVSPAGDAPLAVVLNGTADGDTLQGGLGNDTLTGQAGYDDLFGGIGHDSLDGGDNGDYLYGGGGNDTMLGQSGYDELYGGTGSDALFGGADGDYISAGAGNDSVDGGTGDDQIYGGGGKDSLNGGDGNDRIVLLGSDGGSITGGDGNDRIEATFHTGNLSVDGGLGNDVIDITTNYQDDASEGPLTGGNVTVSGGLGNDTIRVNNYGDTTTILAGDGDDYIEVNAKSGTTVTTGAGADRVEIRSLSAGGGAMVITDFTPGVGGDRLELDAVLEHIYYGGWLGGNPFGQGYLKLVQQGADVALMVDRDGSAAGFAQEAVVIFRGTTVAAFKAANFVPALDPTGVEFPNLSLTGTADDDYLNGGVSNDTLRGESGDDNLFGYYGNDSIIGGAGDDEIEGGGGKNHLDGGDGDDSIYAEGLNDTIIGGAGDDTISSYGQGVTSIDAGAGRNYIRASIYGGSLTVTTGADDDLASIRNDDGGTVTVSLGGGDDYLYFQNYEGLANLSTGVGNDFVNAGGSGLTTLSLGSGIDELWLWGASNSNSGLTVTDFATGSGGDQINLSDVMEQLENLEAPDGDPFAQGYVYLVQRGTSAVLRADLDGAGSAFNPVDLATFANTQASTFTSANFKDEYQPVVRANVAPTVAHAIEDLTTAEDSPSGSFTLPSNTFSDANGDALTLSATLTSGAALPSWLTFTAATRTFSGQAPANFNGVLNVRVTASDGMESVFDDFKITFTPVNDAPTGGISISGTAKQGQALSAVTSSLVDVDGLGAFSYQWLRAGAVITGATASTYTLTQADVGKAISLRLSYTDGFSTAETVTSAATSPVLNVNDAPSGGISISGTAKQGEVLSAVTSSLTDADGLGAFSYQWLRGGAVIAGATASTYKLVLADVGATISLRLKYTDGGATAETVTSPVTAAVARGPINGTAASEAMTGTALGDTMSGLAGNDTIKGLAGNDFLFGDGDLDFLYGGDSHDALTGGAGHDKLFGDAGNDTLFGGDGNDALTGGAGFDRMSGGAGKDSFVFQKLSDSSNAVATADLITDFVRGTDKINLSAIDASTSLAGNNAFVWRGTSSFTTTSKGEVSYKKFDLAGTANDYTLVYLDSDSDKSSEMIIKLTGLYNLTATDFIL